MGEDHAVVAVEISAMKCLLYLAPDLTRSSQVPRCGTENPLKFPRFTSPSVRWSQSVALANHFPYTERESDLVFGGSVKITFVLPFASLAGGVRVVAIYARLLHDRGHDITVISQPREHLPDWKRKVRRLSGRPVGRKAGNRTHLLDFLGDRHIVLEKARPVTQDDVPDADAIIATWWDTAFAIAHLPSSKGRKYYFIQHHEVHNDMTRHISGGSYFLPLKKITISRWLIDTMADLYGDRDVTLIENSVDLEQFHAAERGRQKRPTVGLLYAGTHFKGLDVSLAAIDIARQHVPDLQVVAFGVGKPNADYPLPSDALYFHSPAQDKIRDIYAMCDVWLCGSRAEGYHLPPSEAMACRCPVVSTKVGGTVEIIEEGVNGHLVDVEDSAALGARLAEVLRLPEAEWKAMSDAALHRIQQNSWEKATERFEQVLQH